MANRKKRQTSERVGRIAEAVAEICLRLKGYQVLARRAKTHVGELDLVMRKGALIVIVEVKHRADLDTGRRAVSDASWARIARAADSWLARKGNTYCEMDRRFDLFLTTPKFQLCHLKDIWRPDFALTRS